MRGNLDPQAAVFSISGSIPACAGEPMSAIALQYLERVYPRVCGGTSDLRTWVWRIWGLSPRVRGNRRGGRLMTRDLGSIPACAGEPRGGCGRVSVSRVYPRVCGGTMQ